MTVDNTGGAERGTEEPKTVDGHVGEIKIEVDGEALPQVEAVPYPDEQAAMEEKANALAAGIAGAMDVGTDELQGFALVAEVVDPEQGLMLRSVWSSRSTPWQLRGYAAELVKHLDQV